MGGQADVVDLLVVGGGFGGLYAARTAAHHGFSVALVDAQGHQTFQPLLYQVATGQLPIDVVDYPLRLQHGVEAITDRVTGIDLQAGSVTTQGGRTLVGRSLVIATGASVNFFGVPGAAEHALPLYTDTDALAIKHRLQQLVESSKPFDIVVVGAGATGVEITGALSDVVHNVLPRTYPNFDGASVTVHVVDRAKVPLAHMLPASQAYAAKVLSESGVAFHLGQSVASVTATGVGLDDGSDIPAGMVVWAGGLTVNAPTMSPSPERAGDGRITIDETLRIPGHEQVYCIGDCAADASAPLPQLGSVAKQQGIHVAHSVRRQRHGHAPKPFHYRDLGVMAMLRHYAAVVEAGPRHTEITGKPAFAMWLGLHAALLPDDRDRVDAVHDWIHESTTGRLEFITDPPEQTGPGARR